MDPKTQKSEDQHPMDKSQQVIDGIKNLLASRGFIYEYLEHEPTPTSADSAKVRGTKMEEGAKALILKGKKTGKNFMVTLPGDRKLDTKKIESQVGESVAFENPEVIFQKYGLKVGGIPPFGRLLGIETYFDEALLKNENAAFNCGRPTCSIIMKSKDLKDVLEATVGAWSK